MRTVRAFAPGRTELAGNHTDHQGGRVIAAAVSCGVRLTAQANGTNEACVRSEGFPLVRLSLADLSAHEDERGTTASLVRGVVAALHVASVPMAGFDAQVASDVPAGSGLSSSAAFELALVAALCKLFGGEDETADASIEAQRALAWARMEQQAERDYFGKPCGLMDQLAIACGGANLFDFGCEPVAAQSLPIDLVGSGLALCLINTHCDHSRYTDEYAQVAKDMTAVAQMLGAEGLSQVPQEVFLQRFEGIRHQLGDLPALRGLHYYREMQLVDVRARALQAGDMDVFLQATRQSGASSAQYLQNVSTGDRAEQPAMVALALADLLLQGRGACRIHGGGFGGTVQAFVPVDDLPAFASAIDARLGAGSCQTYDIVPDGARATVV